ncbi:Skp1 family, dimerization domain-containing protein [Hypomontagnella submonticulosa]|nr:Skp1 family, dimerization domain-containing protein [Hypomontagnella submonticulosa]
MSTEVKDTLTLQSADGTELTVSRKAGMKCQIINDMLGDLPESETDFPIPLSQIETPTLKNVVAWLQQHENDTGKEPKPSGMEPLGYNGSRVPQWDWEFFNGLDQMDLFALICAANFLDIADLLSLSTTFVADQIRGMSTVRMREYFCIESDFTPEEEAQIRAEHEWANIEDENYESQGFPL